ncbi:poly [ADP-ribose] polymerase, partial [Elysia marginata]
DNDAAGSHPLDGEYATEYAKSGKSMCRACGEYIPKDSVRISQKEYTSQRAIMYGPQDLWHMVDCFVEKRDELGFTTDMDPSMIKGFGKLKPEDKAMLYEKLGKGKKTATKRKQDSKTDANGGKKVKKEETEEEKTLREQSKMLWDMRDKLARDVSNSAMKLLLQLNKQDVPPGESKILDAVADCLVFGALEKCKECKDGQLYYTAEGYACYGNLTEWTKCMSVTKFPTRKAFKIPKEFHDVPFLKAYKYVKRERAFPVVTVSATSGLVSSSMDSVDGVSTNKPLQDMKFVVAGNLKQSKSDISKTITSLGGVIVSKVDAKTAAVISSKEELEKNSKTIKEAKKLEVHVVSEDFVKGCSSGDVPKLITTHSIASWGSQVEKRTGQRPTKSAPKSGMSAKDEARFTKSVPAKLKMMVKGGAAVDPDSAWGRVGTTIGGNKVERCGSKNSVIASFKEMYLQKTGNNWEDRKNFQKFPNKFYPLEIDYGQDDEEVKKLDLENSTSKLPRGVQEIIRMIFDVESMKKAMMEFEIDMKKMPLGKLSKRQIQSAYSILTELQKKKTDMLDNLMEIEVAYSLLKGGGDTEDPVTAHYNKLKCQMQPLDPSSEEFERLKTYTKNTHASTHTMYDLEVLDVMKIVREGEKQTFRPFKDLKNRMLLWHGSRTTNFAGILSQGLRIAPPEAPVTGYMFGKGVYFADMVSKSANYCRTSKTDNVALMLLCEVALGNMYELKHSLYVNPLPKGKHSTKGLGRTCPDPAENYTTPDGVVVPIGNGVNSGVNDSKNQRKVKMKISDMSTPVLSGVHQGMMLP